MARTSKRFSLETYKQLLLEGDGKRLSLSIPLNPVPAARPRVSQWGTYYPKKYAGWKKQALLYLPTKDPVFFNEVAVIAEHIVQKPKTTKRTNPLGDVDNYLKATLDALTSCEGVWEDDDIVLLTLASKRFTEKQEAPRTNIVVVEL